MSLYGPSVIVAVPVPAPRHNRGVHLNENILIGRKEQCTGSLVLEDQLQAWPLAGYEALCKALSSSGSHHLLCRMKEVEGPWQS